MTDAKLPSVGERIRHLRYQQMPRMTQRELAERAGVSVDLISKLEQGTKQTALLVNLHRIAAALDVDVSALLARPERVEAAVADDGGVVAIRLAITALGDDAEPASLDELQRQARYAWAAYWASHFDVLAGLLPDFISIARATVREHGTPEMHATLSDAYGVAGSMLVHLGYIDLAFLAMELAIGEADSIEPRVAKATPEHIAVWGGLLLSGAVAAARDDRLDEADDLLNLAETAATRLQAAERAVRIDHERPFGMPVVVQVSVDANVATGRPARALEVARRMPPDADLPPAGKARHLADVAAAQTSLGRDREATETLLSIERMAPDWMKYQPFPRTIVRELLERERRVRTPALRGLAARLNVA